MSAKLEIAQIARLENLLVLRNFIEHACRQSGLDDPTCSAVKLAVDEVCTNIITHGYADREPGLITLTLQRDEQQVVVTITDQGQLFDPTQVPSPDLDTDWEQRRVGGMGLHLVRQVMDEVIYQSDPGRGNRLTLIKLLG